MHDIEVVFTCVSCVPMFVLSQNLFCATRSGAATAFRFLRISVESNRWPVPRKRVMGGSVLLATADRQNFSEISLVFGCIGADLCMQIRVLQDFSKSTRLSTK